IRGEMGVAPTKRVRAILRVEQQRVAEELREDAPFIENLGLLEGMEITVGGEPPKAAATAISHAVEVFVPFKDLVPEPKREEARLLKELRKVMEELQFVQRKLSNPAFLERAPGEVVAKERNKAAELEALKGKLEGRLRVVQELIPGGEAPSC
ncbi:MAG: valine--tRNA ligase, partial [Deltaproteobacteria bacterium]